MHIFFINNTHAKKLTKWGNNKKSREKSRLYYIIGKKSDIRITCGLYYVEKILFP